MPTLKGTEASLSFVQCFLHLVSSSINVSIFHVTWLIPSGQTSYVEIPTVLKVYDLKTILTKIKLISLYQIYYIKYISIIC